MHGKTLRPRYNTRPKPIRTSRNPEHENKDLEGPTSANEKKTRNPEHEAGKDAADGGILRGWLRALPPLRLEALRHLVHRNLQAKFTFLY